MFMPTHWIMLSFTIVVPSKLGLTTFLLTSFCIILFFQIVLSSVAELFRHPTCPPLTGVGSNITVCWLL